MNGLARLQRLKEVLVEVSNERRYFDMGNWTRFNCHTASCAAGHAAFDAVLMAEGFKMDQFNHWPIYKKPGWDTAMLPPLTGFAACAEFFELTIEEATHIFGLTYPVAAHKITPEMVIARIDKVLGTSYA